jgi:hypothetical protein
LFGYILTSDEDLELTEHAQVRDLIRGTKIKTMHCMVWSHKRWCVVQLDSTVSTNFDTDAPR